MDCLIAGMPYTVQEPIPLPAMASPSEQHQHFQPTRWSLIVRVREGGEFANEALGELFQAYWSPLYAFARRLGHSSADAEDLVQGFFAGKIDRPLFESADPDKGKLRTFLLTAFNRFINDERRKLKAAKRGGGATILSLDFAGAEHWLEGNASPSASAEQIFDQRWAITVLEMAMDRLRTDQAQKGKLAAFEAMLPLLTDEPDNDTYEKISQQLGITINNARVGVHRLRTRFAIVLRDLVAATHHDEDDVEAELRYLLSVLRD